MADPEARTRTPAEIADHAADLHEDILAAIGRDRHRIAGQDVGPPREHPLRLLERLAAQVEDLAASAARARPGQAFGLGLMDGLAQPGELTVGRTWDDDEDADREYDEGVTFGQRLGQIIR